MRRRKNDYTAMHPRMRWLVAGWIVSGLWRFRWHLAPFYLLAAVGPAGLAAGVAWRVAGGLWLAAMYATAAIIIGSVIAAHVRSGYDRAVAGVGYGAAMTYSALIARDPGDLALWSMLPFGLLLGVPWWVGPTLKPRIRLDQLRRRFWSSKLGEDGGTVVDDEQRGPVRKVRIRLGRRWQEGDKAHVADLLGEPDGAVFTKPDPRTNGRSVEVTVIDAADFSGPEIPHPALAPAATAAGGQWAARSRSIVAPIALGNGRTGELDSIRLHGLEGWRHGALFGASGSGKSNTASVLAAGVTSTVDGVLIGSDVAKRGVTLKPWADALGGEAVPAGVPTLALTAEDTARQIRWLLAECKRRGELVADQDDDDKWIAGPGAAAVIVYLVSEAAALLSDADALVVDEEDFDLSAGLVDLVLLGRQVGIVVVVESQGGDWDSIPTKLRQNLMWSITHRMEPDALRTVWKGLASGVDMSLFDVPGLLYHRDGQVGAGGGDMVPVRSYALYRNADKRRLAKVYAAGSAAAAAPRNGGGGGYGDRPGDEREGRKVATVTTSKGKAAAAGERVDALLAGAVDPAGLRFPDGPAAEVLRAGAEPAVETAAEEEVSARVLAVLRAAGEQAMRKGEIAEAVEVSAPTVLRRLTALRDRGQVEATGSGSATRWRAVRELAETGA